MNRRQTNPLHHVLEQKEIIRVVKLMTCVSNHCSLELFWGIDHHLCGLRTRTRAAAAARIWWTAIYCSCLTAQGCVCTEACWTVFLIGFDRPSVCGCGWVERWICVNVFVCVCGIPSGGNQPRIKPGLLLLVELTCCQDKTWRALQVLAAEP